MLNFMCKTLQFFTNFMRLRYIAQVEKHLGNHMRRLTQNILRKHPLKRIVPKGFLSGSWKRTTSNDPTGMYESAKIYTSFFFIVHYIQIDDSMQIKGFH